MVEKDITAEYDNLGDSQFQVGYKIDLNETKNLWQSMNTLSKSLSNITIVEGMEDRLENFARYSNLSNVVIERSRKIELPENYIGTSEEIKELKGMTFVKYKKDHDDALDETVGALEVVKKVDLKKLPVETLESLIHIMVILCKESNEKVKK